jgi:hypothetical protein
VRASVSALHLRRGTALNGAERWANSELEQQFSLNAFGTVREPLKQIYRRSETTDRIGMRGALQRLLTRPPQKFNRFGYVIAAAVMTAKSPR